MSLSVTGPSIFLGQDLVGGKGIMPYMHYDFVGVRFVAVPGTP